MKVDTLNSELKVQTIVESESIAIVCAADNKYAMPLAVTICSVIENLNKNRKVVFFIIDGGINHTNKQKILKSLVLENCEVIFLSVSDSLLHHIKEVHQPLESETVTIKADYVSITSFYRLLIPLLLPNEFEKAIYLDCDLVVRGDLGELWQADLGGNYVLAAQDSWIPYVSSPTGRLNYQKLGLNPQSKYFNAGVLVINLKKWREDQLTAKAIKYFKQNLEYVGWYDQGILNALLGGQWGEIEPRWNCSPSSVYSYSSWQDSPFSEEDYYNLIHDPYIIHFVSAKKPWNSRHTLLKEYFFQYVDLTAWSGWRLTIWRRLWLRLVREFHKVLSAIQ